MENQHWYSIIHAASVLTLGRDGSILLSAAVSWRHRSRGSLSSRSSREWTSECPLPTAAGSWCGCHSNQSLVPMNNNTIDNCWATVVLHKWYLAYQCGCREENLGNFFFAFECVSWMRGLVRTLLHVCMLTRAKPMWSVLMDGTLPHHCSSTPTHTHTHTHTHTLQHTHIFTQNCKWKSTYCDSLLWRKSEA